jgi:hypothetical protein
MDWIQIMKYKHNKYLSYGFLKFKYFNRNSLGEWFDI